MKAGLALIALCALSACKRTAAEDAVFAFATQKAEMPDCASLHMNWAWQKQESNYYILAAQFVATESCMERWEHKLKNSEFEAQMPHGEWVRSAGWPTVLVSPPAGHGELRGVIIPISKPIPGIELTESTGAQ